MSIFGNAIAGGQRIVEDSRIMEEQQLLRGLRRAQIEDEEAIRRAIGGNPAETLAPQGVPIPRAPMPDKPEAADVQTQPIRIPKVDIRPLEAGAQPAVAEQSPSAGKPAMAGLGAPDPAQMARGKAVIDESRTIDTEVGSPLAGAQVATPRAIPQPGNAATGLRSGSDMDSLERMHTKLSAMEAEALRRNRPDHALAYFTQGAQFRDKIRGMQANNYRQRYMMSNDPNVWAEYFNRYVGNGVSVENIEKGSDGNYVMTSRDISGKQGSTTLKPAEMEQWIRFVENPAGARALEMEHAKRLYDHQLKVQEANSKAQSEMAVEQVKGRFQKVGNVLLDVFTGQKFDAGEVKTLKNPDGSERLVTIRDGKAIDIAGGAAGGMDTGLPKPVAEMIKSAADRIALVGRGALETVDPERQSALLQKMSISQDLIRSAWGSENWGVMQDSLAAELADQIVQGKVKPVQTELRGQPVQMVEYKGRKFVMGLNPFDTARGGPTAPAAQPGQPPAAAPRQPAPSTTPQGLGTQRVTGQISRAPVTVAKPGDVIDGYRFKGGDVRNPASWEPAT